MQGLLEIWMGRWKYGWVDEWMNDVGKEDYMAG